MLNAGIRVQCCTAIKGPFCTKQPVLSIDKSRSPVDSLADSVDFGGTARLSAASYCSRALKKLQCCIEQAGMRNDVQNLDRRIFPPARQLIQPVCEAQSANRSP
jgi:succinate dehydrogenase/fumarate reductase flavoprotein subunit